MTDDLKNRSKFRNILTGMSDPQTASAQAFVKPMSIEVPRINDVTVNPAKWMYERLVKYIKEFEEKLDKDHEIGARLVSFGATITFHIENMGYHGPDIISFYGKNEQGEDLQLIQHTSQLSVLLIAVKKQSEKPRRIGFILDSEKSSEDEKDL